MSLREREKAKKKLTNAKAWAESQDRGFASTSIRLPDGKQFFNTKKPGTYRVDILPYKVGKGNRRADPGMYHFERTYYVHKNVGSGEDSYCCLKENFKRSCPVCEHAAKLRAEGAPEDQIKALRPQVRMLWNVIDLGEKEKGVQVWDTAYFKSFGEMLKAKIDAADEEDNYGDFAELVGGKTLKLTVVDDSFNGRSFRKVSNIEMKDRPDYDGDVLDQVVCLDDCLVEMDYGKLKAIFLQEPEAEDDEPRKGGGKAASKAPANGDDDDEEEDEGEDEDEEEEEGTPAYKKGDKVAYMGQDCEVVKVASNGRLTLEDDDGETYKDVDPEDVQAHGAGDEDEEEEEEEEEKHPARAKGGKNEDDEEDDDDDEEEDDDEDDEEEDDDEDDEEEDDDEEEPPAKKVGKKPAPGKPGKKKK